MRLARGLAAVAALTVGIGTLLGQTAAPSAQQPYPSKPITMIVPWPAGGSTDLVMRALSEAASKNLGQPIVIDNKSGASGTLGPAGMAAAAKPDGYTITQMPVTVMRMPLMQKASWDPKKDFSYIIHLTGYTFGVTTKYDGPFKTWKDVVDFAKANPKKVTYATPGSGTTLHIGMEQIAAHSGIELVQVPFKGGAETGMAVLGGNTMLQADSTGWKPLVEAKKLRVLALWTPERSPNWPDTPTLKELGYPFVFDSPFGIAGPKGMDPAIVKRLHDAYKAALDAPAVKEMMAKYDMFPRYMNSADYAASVDSVIEQERKALALIGKLRKD